MKAWLNKNVPMGVNIAIIAMFIFTLFNTCGSSIRKKENIRMRKEIDTLTIQLNATKEVIRNLPQEFENKNNEQLARFLFWERQADRSEYKNYTIKDFENLIKK